MAICHKVSIFTHACERVLPRNVFRHTPLMGEMPAKLKPIMCFTIVKIDFCKAPSGELTGKFSIGNPVIEGRVNTTIPRF